MRKEREWVVYGCFGDRLGRIDIERDSSFDIKYTDGQIYPSESWSKDYARGFYSIQGVCGYLIKNKKATPIEVKREVRHNFPREMKKS